MTNRSSTTSLIVLDPICGMQLTSDQIVAKFSYIHEEYSFCSVECHDMFSRRPEQYITHLAHEPKGHLGHFCPMRRES